MHLSTPVSVHIALTPTKSPKKCALDDSAWSGKAGQDVKLQSSAKDCPCCPVRLPCSTPLGEGSSTRRQDSERRGGKDVFWDNDILTSKVPRVSGKRLRFQIIELESTADCVKHSLKFFKTHNPDSLQTRLSGSVLLLDLQQLPQLRMSGWQRKGGQIWANLDLLHGWGRDRRDEGKCYLQKCSDKHRPIFGVVLLVRSHHISSSLGHFLYIYVQFGHVPAIISLCLPINHHLARASWLDSWFCQVTLWSNLFRTQFGILAHRQVSKETKYLLSPLSPCLCCLFDLILSESLLVLTMSMKNICIKQGLHNQRWAYCLLLPQDSGPQNWNLKSSWSTCSKHVQLSIAELQSWWALQRPNHIPNNQVHCSWDDVTKHILLQIRCSTYWPSPTCTTKCINI